MKDQWSIRLALERCHFLISMEQPTSAKVTLFWIWQWTLASAISTHQMSMEWADLRELLAATLKLIRKRRIILLSRPRAGSLAIRLVQGNIFNNSPKHLEAELENSLRRLGVEAVDLYYLHRRDHNVPIEEVTETLAAFVKSGKVKAIGFSEIAPTTLRRAHAVHSVAAVQSEYSLSTRSPELGLMQTCAELGVSMVAFSPVGRSLLTDSPISMAAVQDLAFLKNNPRFITPNYEANFLPLQGSDHWRQIRDYLLRAWPSHGSWRKVIMSSQFQVLALSRILPSSYKPPTAL